MEFLGLSIGGVVLAGGVVAYFRFYRPLSRENSRLLWLLSQKETELRDERQLSLDIEQWVVIEGGGKQTKMVQSIVQRIKERRQGLEQLRRNRGSL